MAFSAGSITGDIELDRNPARQALDAMVKDAQQFKGRMDKEIGGAAQAGAKSWKEALHGIKGEFGRRSVFGESLELLAGAGVVAGVGMAAEKFGALGQKIGDLSVKARLGQISAGDLNRELIEGIPIVGELARGLGGLTEAISGQRAAAEMEVANAKKLSDAWHLRADAVAESMKMAHSADDAFRKLAQGVQLALTPPSKEAGVRRAQEYSNERHQIVDDFAAAAKKGPGTEYWKAMEEVAYAKKVESDARTLLAKDKAAFEKSNPVERAGAKWGSALGPRTAEEVAYWKSQNAVFHAVGGTLDAERKLRGLPDFGPAAGDAAMRQMGLLEMRRIAEPLKGLYAGYTDWVKEANATAKADREKRMEAGKGLAADLATPLERNRGALKNALDLFNAGAIDRGTLASAYAHARGTDSLTPPNRAEEYFGGPSVVTSAGALAAQPLDEVAKTSKELVDLTRQIVDIIRQGNRQPPAVTLPE